MRALLHVLGIALSLLAILLVLIGLATTGWLSYYSVHIGLFRICSSDECITYSPTGSQTAVRFFVVVGFLLAIVGVANAAFYYVRYIQKELQNKILPLLAGACLAAAGASCILGAIIWAAKAKKEIEVRGRTFDLGYSFALDIVGGIMLGAAGGLIIVQTTKPN